MASRMTPLGHVVAARIAAEGPMRLDEYMALCLGHPEHGYYTTRDPFGRGRGLHYRAGRSA